MTEGVARYKADLRAAYARIAELESKLAAAMCAPTAASYSPKLAGTNAEKVAYLTDTVRKLQARLRAAGLSGEV